MLDILSFYAQCLNPCLFFSHISTTYPCFISRWSLVKPLRLLGLCGVERSLRDNRRCVVLNSFCMYS